jgi:hypothetical protein
VFLKELDAMKRLTGLLIGAAVLTGCTVQTYIPPTSFEQSQPTPTLSRTVDKSLAQTWEDLIAHAHRSGFAVKHEQRNKDIMTVWLPAFEPALYISCGSMRVQQGSFTTHTRFLDYLSEGTETNLNVMADVSLRALAPNKTEVSVMAHYTFRINFTNDPVTGAMQGGQTYRFDSAGSAGVTLQPSGQGMGFEGLCQPTGAAEQTILRAARGSSRTP